MPDVAAPSQAGQFVVWIGGGPPMLVRGFTPLDPNFVPNATCVWFSPDGHYHTAQIPVTELRVVPPPPPGP